jgi:cohesin loading factor subunit SCC2
LGVRKRVIKLLKAFYGVVSDLSRQTDIATRIVLRMMDEDETVRDLAIKTIEELWFPFNPTIPSAKLPSSQFGKHADNSALLNKVTVIMGTATNFKDRQSPLEDILHKIMAEKTGNEASVLHTRYTEVCETLIDGLVDATDLPGFVSDIRISYYESAHSFQTVVNCVRTIYLFTSAHPPILSSAKATTLLPYLKNASTVN